MHISSASTLKGFAVTFREGINVPIPGVEGIEGSEGGINHAIADVIDISTEGQSFANWEENNEQESDSMSVPQPGESGETPANPELIGQQPESYSSNIPATKSQSDSNVNTIPPQSDSSRDTAQPLTAEQPVTSQAGISARKKLSVEDQQIVNDLKQRDMKVRAHDQAHLAAAGQYASGGISYS